MAPLSSFRCQSCGEPIGIDDRFCSECGAPNAAAEVTPSSSAFLFSSARAPQLALAGHDVGDGIPNSAVPAKNSQTRERSWPRRHLFVIPLLLVMGVLGAGAFYAIRIRDTVNTLNSISTPAPIISGAVLGGSSSIQIDTGIAKTEVAIANAHGYNSNQVAGAAGSPSASSTADKTDTPSPTATEIPTTVPTVAPTQVIDSAAVVATEPASGPQPATVATMTPGTIATSSSTATSTPSPTPSATATATPSPTPVLSQIERVKNGDFESGADDWYVSDGGQIANGEGRAGGTAMEMPASGGFADQPIFYVAESQYEFTAWGRMSASGDSGLIGVIYKDANGNRIESEEPTPMKFTTSEYTQQTMMFTPPKDASEVDIYLWKGSGSAALYGDDFSVRSVIPPATAEETHPKGDKTTMNILVMGVDARPGESIDTGVRPDSLMVVRLDGDSGSCHILAIPRDTRTNLPGYGLTKINHALAVGGIDYEKLVVEQLLNINIDHYVLIDFNGFQDLVNAVGGVTVDVPADFTSSDGTVFQAGTQQMTGQQALSYARYRGGPDGDFGRIQRQQAVLRALAARAYGLNIVRSINELLPAVKDNLRTDFSATEMARIATEYRSKCTEDNISMMTLDGSEATYQDPLLNLPLDYVIVDPDEIRAKVAALSEP